MYPADPAVLAKVASTNGRNLQLGASVRAGLKRADPSSDDDKVLFTVPWTWLRTAQGEPGSATPQPVRTTDEGRMRRLTVNLSPAYAQRLFDARAQGADAASSERVNCRPHRMRAAMATAGSRLRAGCFRPRGAVDRGQDPGSRHTLPVTAPVGSTLTPYGVRRSRVRLRRPSRC
ncbi:hypothetical protein GCM10010343_12330 [Streptomyces avidinii]|nr:hypothetical protein GCM10010343_12330 [Streptomyces avidinii]